MCVHAYACVYRHKHSARKGRATVELGPSDEDNGLFAQVFIEPLFLEAALAGINDDERVAC